MSQHINAVVVMVQVQAQVQVGQQEKVLGPSKVLSGPHSIRTIKRRSGVEAVHLLHGKERTHTIVAMVLLGDPK